MRRASGSGVTGHVLVLGGREIDRTVRFGGGGRVDWEGGWLGPGEGGVDSRGVGVSLSEAGVRSTGEGAVDPEGAAGSQ